jgi:hypothetical protein
MREDPIIVINKGCQIPFVVDEKEDLIADIQEAVQNVLKEHEIDPDHMDTYIGDVFTETNVHIKCTDCYDHLELTELYPGPENEAYATVNCSCGWFGTAVYRLIDLHDDSVEETTTDNLQTRLDPELAVEVENTKSTVSKGDFRAKYIPYATTEWYMEDSLE